MKPILLPTVAASLLLTAEVPTIAQTQLAKISASITAAVATPAAGGPFAAY